MENWRRDHRRNRADDGPNPVGDEPTFDCLDETIDCSLLTGEIAKGEKKKKRKRKNNGTNRRVSRVKIG